MAKKRKTYVEIDIGKMPDWLYAEALAIGYKALVAKRKAARLKKKRRKR